MNAPVPVLIVDDEWQSRSLIRKLLSDFPGTLFQAAEAGNVIEAITCISQQEPRLIFLDVMMRGESGFDLLDQLTDSQAEIIFTTAHSEFAVKAFRYSAMDYLMKPLASEEFNAAVHKVIQRIAQHAAPPAGQVEFLQSLLHSNAKAPDKLMIPTQGGFIFIAVSDILYCRAVSNYTEFHLSGNEKIVSSYTLGYYEELLSGQSFFRAHRSYLVNLTHIKMYRRGDGGTLIMQDGQEIEISRTNKEAFLRLFKQ
jgi:two-component system LytT family response regulator